VKPGAGLVEIVEALAERYPIPDTPSDPFELILWENIGYLVDDERRRRLFDDFGRAVGFDPARVAAADDALLLRLAKAGGMRPETRVERWREIARIVLEDCGGDLAGTLRDRPIAKARILLKRFPTIADPGADKVLLLTGIAATPALESNGLRALARLGFFTEQAAYGASYKAGIEALAREGRGDGDWLATAFHGLRQHGKTLCKRGEPQCLACPLDGVCAHVAVRAL
jgi:endonuclease-3